MEQVSLILPIAKVDECAHIIYGVVYKAAKMFSNNGLPTDMDTHGNWATAEEVKKACHNFNRKLQRQPKAAVSKAVGAVGVDRQHNEIPGYGIVLESYIAKAAIPEINADVGDWVAAVEVTDPACWQEVLKGDIEGFSIGGTAHIRPVDGGEKER